MRTDVCAISHDSAMSLANLATHETGLGRSQLGIRARRPVAWPVRPGVLRTHMPTPGNMAPSTPRIHHEEHEEDRESERPRGLAAGGAELSYGPEQSRVAFQVAEPALVNVPPPLASWRVEGPAGAEGRVAPHDTVAVTLELQQCGDLTRLPLAHVLEGEGLGSVLSWVGTTIGVGPGVARLTFSLQVLPQSNADLALTVDLTGGQGPVYETRVRLEPAHVDRAADESFFDLVERWNGAGRLDEPQRPAGVAPFPPIDRGARYEAPPGPPLVGPPPMREFLRVFLGTDAPEPWRDPALNTLTGEPWTEAKWLWVESLDGAQWTYLYRLYNGSSLEECGAEAIAAAEDRVLFAAEVDW
jgi:hypothetical protein